MTGNVFLLLKETEVSQFSGLFFKVKALYQLPNFCKKLREAKRAEKGAVTPVGYILTVFNIQT